MSYCCCCHFYLLNICTRFFFCAILHTHSAQHTRTHTHIKDALCLFAYYFQSYYTVLDFFHFVFIFCLLWVLAHFLLLLLLWLFVFFFCFFARSLAFALCYNSMTAVITFNRVYNLYDYLLPQ